MNSPRTTWYSLLIAVLKVESLRLTRDRFLVGTSIYVCVVMGSLRWVVPWLRGAVGAHGLDLDPYLPMAMSYMVLVNAAVLVGTIGGFLLIELREEGMVRALRVTPVPISTILGAMCLAMGVLGAVLGILLSLLAGCATPPLASQAVASCLVAPTGVVLALILGSTASNRIEAFALLKMTSLVGLVPVGAFFVEEPWQFIAGLTPAYWGCKLWWLASGGEERWGWVVLLGSVVSLCWLYGSLMIARRVFLGQRALQ